MGSPNKILAKLIFFLFIIILVVTQPGCGKKKIKIDTSNPPVKVGWSDWVGWMPWEIVEKKGLLKENGANAELVYYNDYTASLEALKDGKIAAVSVTINDALSLKSKIDDLQIILINDVSDGGDGILVKKNAGITSVKDLKGKIVSLEENSVSHYLFLRALENDKVDPKDVTINNVSADLAGKAFLGSAFLDDKYTQAIVTWNPHLLKAKEQGKGDVIFDSSQIYGEITDVLVARKSFVNSRKQDFQAIINAWYGAMEMIDSSKTRDEAIKIMAKKSNTSVQDFEKLLFDTEIFTKPKKGVDFMGVDGKGKLSKFIERVMDFSVKQKIISKKFDLSDFLNPAFIIEYYNNN